jgi:hypothetical protein
VKGKSSKLFKSNPFKTIDDVNVPYVDFVFGGLSNSAQDGRLGEVLDHSFRNWVQIKHRAEVPNQSPNLDEFVFVGTTFGLVLLPDRSTLEERFAEIVMMWAVYGAFYLQMTVVCADIVRELPRLREGFLEELTDYEHQVQIYFNELAAPSLTYRRDLRIYRESIFNEWDMHALHQRSSYLLTLLGSWRLRARERRLEFWGRVVGGVLALLTALNIVSAFWDSVQIHDYFSGAPSRQTQIKNIGAK